MDVDAKIRCQRRMDRVDAMYPALRALVHKWGLTVIDAFTDCGMRGAQDIEECIASIHAGKPAFHPWIKKAHRDHLIRIVTDGSVEIGNRETPMLLRRERRA